MRLSARHSLWIVAAVLLAGCREPDSGLQLPLASLQPVDDSARQALATARELATSLTSTGAPAAEQADAVAALGRLYHRLAFLDAADTCYAQAARLDPANPSWPHLRGYRAQIAGDLEQAVTHYRAALAIAPRRIHTLERLAEAELAIGRWQQARESWEAAIEEGGDSAGARYGLGRAAMAQGDTRTAVGELLRAIELAPGATRIHHPLAQAYMASGDEERAQHHLGLAGPAPLGIADPDTDAIATQDSGTQGLLRTAQDQLAAGDLEGALGNLETAAQISPDNAEVAHNIAVLHARAGDLPGATDAYRRLIELRPDDASAHFSLGNITATMGDVGGAIPHFRRAVALAPDFKQARYNLAGALQQSGDPAAAAAEYAQVLDLDDDFGATHADRGLALAASGQVETALEELAGRLARAPLDAVSRRALGIILRGSGRGHEAIAILTVGIDGPELLPAEQADLLLERAKTHDAHGRPAAALADIERARPLDPSSVEAVVVAGGALLQLGRAREAAGAFASALQVRPQLVPARLGRARALAQLGRCREGVEVLSAGLVLLPGDPNLTRSRQALSDQCADGP